MSIKDLAKRDIQRIMGNSNEYNLIIISTPDGSKSVTLTGMDSVIHLGVDTDGNAVNAKKAHVSFPEKPLIDANYPVRNAKGIIDLNNHTFKITDSTGNVKKYVLQSVFPDETLGVLTCILQDYE